MKTLTCLALTVAFFSSAHAGTFTVSTIRFLGTSNTTIYGTGNSSATIDLANTQVAYYCGASAFSTNGGGTDTDYSQLTTTFEWRVRWEGTPSETPPGVSNGFDVYSISGTASGHGLLFAEASAEDDTGTFATSTSTLQDNPWCNYQPSAYAADSYDYDSAGTNSAIAQGHQLVFGILGTPGYLNGKQIRYGYLRWSINVQAFASAEANGNTINPFDGEAGSDAVSDMKVRLIKVEGQDVAPDF